MQKIFKVKITLLISIMIKLILSENLSATTCACKSSTPEFSATEVTETILEFTIDSTEPTKLNENIEIETESEEFAKLIQNTTNPEKSIKSIENVKEVPVNRAVSSLPEENSTSAIPKTTTMTTTKIKTTSTSQPEIIVAATVTEKITASSSTPMPDAFSENAVFFKLGSYRGFNDTNEYQKTYFISRVFRCDWLTAKTVCNAYGMELATFETLDEFSHFQQLCQNSPDVQKVELELFVDGITKKGKSQDEWFWTKTGKKVSFELPWMRASPNFASGVQYCLAIGKVHAEDLVKFNDVICNNFGKFFTYSGFVCQKNDFVI